MMQSEGTTEHSSCVCLQGLSLLKVLGELDDWSAIYAVARSEIPLSSKTHRLPLDLDDKEVMTCSISCGFAILYACRTVHQHA